MDRRRSSGWRCVLVLCLLMGGGLWSGCLHRMPKVKPPIKVPSAFGQLGNVARKERWWRSLQDRHVTRLVRLGLQGSLDLGAARARLLQRMAIARKAGADRFPTLSLDANARVGTNGVALLSRFFAGLSASFELDIWGRVRNSVAAARLDVLSSQETLKAAAISLSGEVAVSWYNLVERQGQVTLIKQQMNTNQQSLDLLMARFRLGQRNAPDVLQQRQLLEAQRGELVQVKAQRQVLLHQLAVLIGRHPRGLKVPAVDRFGPLPALPKAGLPAALIKRRPDIRSAYLSVLAAHRRVGVAIADQFPRLTLSATANVASNVNSNQIFNNWLANLLAGLLGPIFDGGARRAEVARTKAAAKEALQQYGAVILRALREVEDALTREQAQQQLIANQRKQLKLAEQVVKRIRFRYYNGAENFLRVLDAVRSLQALQRRQLTAQRDLWLARVALCRALAGGWKMQAKNAAPKARP